jgi:exonuclease I
MINPKSLANLNPKARFMNKQRFNTTLRPETIAWLQEGGNASQRIEDLVTAAKRKELKFNWEMIAGLTAGLTAEVEQLKTANRKIVDRVKEIMDKHEGKVKGFNTNAFGEGIKMLRSLLTEPTK